MSNENMELVRGIWEADRRRDWEAAYAVYAEDVIWEDHAGLWGDWARRAALMAFSRRGGDGTMRGGFTTVEETLLQEGRGDSVIQQRRDFQEAMRPRFRQVIGRSLAGRWPGFLSGGHQHPDLLGELKESGQPARYEPFDQIWLSPTLALKQTGAFIDRRTRHSGAAVTTTRPG